MSYATTVDALLAGKTPAVQLTNPIGCNVKWKGKERHWMPPERATWFNAACSREHARAAKPFITQGSLAMSRRCASCSSARFVLFSLCC
jgi:hypothetical protein